jgi:hypothetical protein
MSNNFIQNEFFNRKSSPKSFLTDKRTVCVKHKDGHITQHPNITNPWKYIVKVKTNIDVESAWILDE